MADYRVRFVGDLGNLGQFNASIRGALAANSRILNQANSSLVSRSIGAPINPAGASGPGFTIRNAITEIDKFNNAIVQSGQVVQRYIQDYTSSLNQATGRFETTPVFGEAFHSDFRKAIANADDYAQVVGRLAPVEQRLQAIQKSGADRLTQIQNAGIAINQLGQIPRNQRIGPEYDKVYKSAFSDLRAALGANFRLPTYQLQDINLDPLTGKVLTDVEIQQKKLAGDPILTDKALVNVKNADIKTWEDLKRAVVLSGKNIDATFAGLQRNLLNLGETSGLVTQAQITALQKSPLVRAMESKALYAATNPGGYIGAQGANILAQYPDIRKDLIRKAGLGLQQPYQVGGQLNQNFFQAAEQQQFQVTSVTKDMERGLTQIRGSLIDTNGVMNEFSYAIDKNGNAINTWGRRLSGARGFLNQTGRDLVKVIEWTIATTVVFGALGAAIGSISTINELNLNLQRFAITARLSSEELETMFKGLGQVAFATATPIGELVKAADDMALATRRANQSTNEWHQSILELANAVGILTNISGLDTVRATDLLVASMKQLSLTTKDLVPLLSQITAAGGGQANAITDITTGLAGLAEAAEQARVPLTGQIAALQVISQITGKSAEETTNAFKNLFGAINADSSVKKLREFGIAVRDSNGELRPFLEIYRDLADKIRSGVVPQGRVNEILRAISGGRTARQADAAALLANIYKVFEVQGVVANASNEALIANAKILDTNQAKIVRFQNAFKIEIYEKFNETVRDMVGVLADVGTIFAAVFGLFPGPFVTAATEVLALAAAFTLLGKAMTAIGLARVFNNLTGLGKGAGAAAGLVGQGLKFNPQSPGSNPLIAGGLGGLLPVAMQEAALNKALAQAAATGTVAGTLLSNERTLASRFALGAKNELEDIDLRAALGLRAASSVSPLRPQYDPMLDLPLIGVPSQPYTTLPYKVPRINYMGDSSQEFGIAARFANEPIIKDADVLGRRIGAAASTGVATGIFNGVSRFLRGKGGLAIAGAGIGAGAAAAGGTDIAGLGQIVGASLLFSPLAPLGAGLLAGSTLLQAVQADQEKVKTSAKELQSTLYDLTQQWKQDEAGVRAAQESYDKISQSLRTAEKGTETYTDLQTQLSEATIDLALAFDTQAGSTQKIIDTLNKLGGGNDKLSQFAKGLVGQNLTPEQLKELVGLVSEQILAASGQPVFRPKTDFNYSLNYGPTTNEGIPLLRRGLLGPEQSTISPEEFILNPNFFKDFLTQYSPFGGGPIDFANTQFPFSNPAAISAFGTAAETYRQGLPQNEQRAFIDNVITPFQEAVAQFGNAASQISQAITNTRAEIEARQLLGLLSGKDAEVANANIGAAERLQEFISSPRAVIGGGEGPGRVTGLNQYGVNEEEANRTILQLQANALTGTFDPKLFKQAADESIKSFGLWEQLPEGIERTTAEAKILREEFGLTDEQIIKTVGSLGNLKSAASEALEEAIAKTEEWRQSQLQQVGDRLVDLQARIQGGEFDKEPKLKEALQSQLANYQEGINKAAEAAKQFTQTLGAEGAAAAATTLLGSLNALQINGFQGVEGSIDAANAALFGLMTRLNLSGPQIAAVVGKWAQVLILAARVAAIAQRIASLPNLTGSNYTGGPSSLISGDVSAQSQMDALLKEINSILKTGKGTSPLVPSATSSGSSASTDTLYLSEEQQKLADPLSVVKQAYQDALKLQAEIPGEAKRNRSNTVVVIDELEKIFTARGVSEELLRRALDNLTEQMNIANQKADTIRRIRIGGGDFSAIANVPVNLQSGVSVGANNQINITFNLGGTNLTPAQFNLFANQIASEIARRL